MAMPIYDEHDEASDTMLEALTAEWLIWCQHQGLIATDAEEMLLSVTLNKYQRIYVSSFIVRWDAAMGSAADAFVNS